MGGWGSGVRNGRPTVEATGCLKLDVNTVTRAVREAMARQEVRTIPEGRHLSTDFTLRWTRSGEAKPWAAVRVRLMLHPHAGTARLTYDVEHISHRTGPQDYEVQMETTPCRYGGVRWWWLCPATWRRCAVLYLPNGGYRFLSRGRGAYRLAYASQREGWLDRAHGRAAKLHRKLGSDYNLGLGPDVPRPKGMRRATYEPIKAELLAIDEALDEGIFLKMAGFMARSERLASRKGRRARARRG